MGEGVAGRALRFVIRLVGLPPQPLNQGGNSSQNKSKHTQITTRPNKLCPTTSKTTYPQRNKGR